MKIQDFISTTFEKISNNFPKACITYQFDEKAGTHYVKISPPDVYDNETFVNIGWEIKDAFNDYFPDEELCFLTENSLIQLSNPSRIWNPSWNEEILIEGSSFSISKTFWAESFVSGQLLTNVKLEGSSSSILSASPSAPLEDDYLYAMAA